MLSPFIDSSVDNVLLLTSTSHFEFIDVPKRQPIDSLLHDTANIVNERAEVGSCGSQIGEMKFIDVFVHFSAYSDVLIFSRSAQTDVG